MNTNRAPGSSTSHSHDGSRVEPRIDFDNLTNKRSISARAKSANDYWAAIESMKSGYLDGLWDSARGCFADDKYDLSVNESPTAASTNGNGTYPAANAVNNDGSNDWRGAASQTAWTLSQQFAEAKVISHTRIAMFAGAGGFIDARSLDVVLEFSDDGAIWASTGIETVKLDDWGPEQTDVIIPVPTIDAHAYWRLSFALNGVADATCYPRVTEWHLYSAEPGYAYTHANAEILSLISLMAKHGRADATDKARASSVVNLLTTAATGTLSAPAGGALATGRPTYIVGTTDADQHASLDTLVTEALWMAYNNASYLGLSEAQKTAIKTTLNTSSIWSTALYTNQAVMRWYLNNAFYAQDIGITAAATAQGKIADYFGAIEDYYDTAPGDTLILPHVNPDHTIARDQTQANNATETNYNALHYAALCFAGLLWNPELEAITGVTALDATTKNRIRAMARQVLGSWQLSGYPNWDSGESTTRMGTAQYYGWCIRSLTALARCSDWQTDPADGAIAKHILDKTIDFVATADAWTYDPADGAIPSQIWGAKGICAEGNGGQGYNNQKSFGNAMIAKEWALAIDLGVADQASYEVDMIYRYNWDCKNLVVSTKTYSCGSVLANYGDADGPLWRNPVFGRFMDPNGRPLLPLNATSSALAAQYKSAFRLNIPLGYFTGTRNIGVDAGTTLQVFLPEGSYLHGTSDWLTDFYIGKLTSEGRAVKVIATETFTASGSTYLVTYTTIYYPTYIDQKITVAKTAGGDQSSSIYISIPSASLFEADLIVDHIDDSGVRGALYTGATDTAGVTDYSTGTMGRGIHIRHYDATRAENHGVMVMMLSDTTWDKVGRKIAFLARQYLSHTPRGSATVMAYIQSSAAVPDFTWHALWVPTNGTNEHANLLYDLYSVEANRTALEAQAKMEQAKMVVI